MCLKIFLITLSLLRLISGRMQDFALDVNDILNERLMPMSLVAFESGDKSEMRNLSQQSLDDEFQCATRGKVREEDGTFNNAFSAMGYHRNMINNFLCSKFIAEKILDDIQPRQLERRLGVAKFSPEMEFMGNNSLDGGSKSHMLYDEGSYEYKNWLAKTTTLSDVYRNMGMNPQEKNNRQDQFIDEAADNIDYNNEYDEGDVTGFMQQKPLPNSGINSFDHFSSPQATAGSKTGKRLAAGSSFSEPSLKDFSSLSSGYSYNAPTAQQSYSYGPPAYQHPALSGIKMIGIKDLFDIALTTLAFLSFGMFIIQVIICITMAKSADNSVMLPMEMTADGAEVETGELEVRVKRAIEEHTPDNGNIKQINDISKRALQSIEAFVVAKHDRGQCLKKFICENNKFSRKALDIQKYTIPIFGISLSYISNKINNFPINASLSDLQAAIIGLGNGNCAIFKCSSDVLIKRRK